MLTVARGGRFSIRAKSFFKISGSGCLRTHSANQENSHDEDSNAALNNLVGPADPKSNIRRILYAKKKNESSKEMEYRQLQQDLNTWHQEFWTKHNDHFNQSKKAFLAQQSSEIKMSSNKQVADDMSVFYKNFLDQNFRLHVEYQKKWYMKNFSILWVAVQVSIMKLLNRGLPWKSK